MKRVLITDAHGQVGAHLVRELASHGVGVVAVVPEGADERALSVPDVQPFYGSLSDAQRLREAVAGCDTVFHLGLPTEEVEDQPEGSLLNPHQEALRNVMTAARDGGAQRVVFMSDACAVGSRRKQHDALLTEADWSHPGADVHTAVQVETERLAYLLARALDTELVVVVPSLVLGARDYRVGPGNAVIRDTINGVGLPAWGGLNFTSAQDVAATLLQAALSGRPGQRYLVAGENLSNRQLAALVADVTGEPVRLSGLPLLALMVLATLSEGWALLLRRPTAFNRAWVRRLAGRYHHYDASKTQRELGVASHPVRESLEDTVRWLLMLGAIEEHRAQLIAPRLYPS